MTPETAALQRVAGTTLVEAPRDQPRDPPWDEPRDPVRDEPRDPPRHQPRDPPRDERREQQRRHDTSRAPGTGGSTTQDRDMQDVGEEHRRG